MVRISKKDRLKTCPRKPFYGIQKTGPKKDKLPKGYKEHANAFIGSATHTIFIPKVK